MPRSFRVGTGVAVCTAGALLFAPLIATPANAAPSESVVISEVYVDGGAKGAIRLAVLQADLVEALPQRPLRVLDIGAGLGHMSLWPKGRGSSSLLDRTIFPSR